MLNTDRLSSSRKNRKDFWDHLFEKGPIVLLGIILLAGVQKVRHDNKSGYGWYNPVAIVQDLARTEPDAWTYHRKGAKCLPQRYYRWHWNRIETLIRRQPSIYAGGLHYDRLVHETTPAFTHTCSPGMDKEAMEKVDRIP